MPSQGQNFDMTGSAMVSGWGTLTSGGFSPETLNYVEVPLVDDAGKIYLTTCLSTKYHVLFLSCRVHC